METAVENDVRVAVSVHVLVLLRVLFPGRVDALCVHAAYQRGYVELGFRCEITLFAHTQHWSLFQSRLTVRT